MKGQVVSDKGFHVLGIFELLVERHEFLVNRRIVGDAFHRFGKRAGLNDGGTYEAMLSNITLPETAKYLIAVSRYGLANEATFGAYSLTLMKQG